MRTWLGLALGLAVSATFLSAGEDLENGDFFIGVYSADPQNDATFERLKAAGVTYVHSYNSWNDDDPAKILDLAEKHGLRVMYDLRSGKKAAGGKDDPEWQAKYHALLDQIKDHPALGFWYLWDEPGTADLPRLREINNLVKAASDAPTALAINERANYWDTRGYSDIWMPDNYPVRGQPFPDAPLANGFSRMVRNAATAYRAPGVPFVPILQMCDFSCFAGQAPADHRATLRYPNLVEERFMILSALTYGCRGMFFFSYWHSHLDRPAGRAFFNDVFTPLAAELGDFAKAVSKVWNVTAHDRKLDTEEKVSLGYWARPEGNYLIVVNDTKDVRDLSIDLRKYPLDPKWKYGKWPMRGTLKPWGRTAEKTATLKNGVLALAGVEPWESFIYKIE